MEAKRLSRRFLGRSAQVDARGGGVYNASQSGDTCECYSQVTSITSPLVEGWSRPWLTRRGGWTPKGMEIMTDRPELPVVAVAGDERALLEQFLNYYRAVVARKLHGVSDADARRIQTPSGMSMLGLVRHLAGVELRWFVERLTGETPQYLWTQADQEADPRTAWKPHPDETVASVLGFYHRAGEEARVAVRGFGFDEEARHADTAARGITLRWILLHMLEETARHAGHLDLMREQIDGAVGN